jgi:hypothetical protein
MFTVKRPLGRGFQIQKTAFIGRGFSAHSTLHVIFSCVIHQERRVAQTQLHSLKTLQVTPFDVSSNPIRNLSAQNTGLDILISPIFVLVFIFAPREKPVYNQLEDPKAPACFHLKPPKLQYGRHPSHRPLHRPPRPPPPLRALRNLVREPRLVERYFRPFRPV